MQNLDWFTSRRMEGNEFASLICLLLLAILTPAAALAQTATPRFESSTMGTQLVVEGPQGSFTASLGSALSDQVRQTLQPGTAVQVSGVAATINGKSYLLARKLTVAGNQI